MIIRTSRVDMSSSRQYIYHEHSESASITERAGQAVKLDLSKEAKSLSEQFSEHQKAQREKQEERQQKNMQDMLKRDKMHTSMQDMLPQGLEEEVDWKVKILRQILRALRGEKGLDPELPQKAKGKPQPNNSQISLSASASSSFAFGASSVIFVGGTGQEASTGSGTMWTRTTVTSGFMSEMENTAFQSQGVAFTTDGREIKFGVTVEMSRAFCAEFESFSQQDFVVTDPLMINVDSNVANISDMKFLFDIDADGQKEEVSLAGKGSGFLALDKNGDGTIHDGSELFGTKSGDGFKDLATYDEDGNGWIDEADSVFKRLKIWSKDENGKDVLIDLKKADVGAIYLGNAATEFSVKSGLNNVTDAIVRKTGIYLKESGGVGTVQHVDLAV